MVVALARFKCSSCERMGKGSNPAGDKSGCLAAGSLEQVVGVSNPGFDARSPKDSFPLCRSLCRPFLFTGAFPCPTAFFFDVPCVGPFFEASKEFTGAFPFLTTFFFDVLCVGPFCETSKEFTGAGPELVSISGCLYMPAGTCTSARKPMRSCAAHGKPCKPMESYKTHQGAVGIHAKP
jgi:hypothetical protein